MDCGPAALKCLLDGHGIGVSYSRLRDACQTDVDGTSIDTMEVLANQLGLSAEQIVIPVDHVLLSAAKALPAIAVVTLSERLTHFVVVWRRHGPFVQVMDPAAGRRWITAATLLRELYQHRAVVAIAEWRAWAASSDFERPLRQRLSQVGVADSEAEATLQRAAADSGWRSLARLDAAVRMVQAVIDARGFRRGRAAVTTLRLLLAPDAALSIPDRFWTVAAADPDDDGGERVAVTGAVLVRVGVDAPAAERPAAATPLQATVERVRESAPPNPWRELVALLRADRGTLVALGLAGFAAAGIVVVEALLFRALLELGWFLQLPQQRLGAVAALMAFVAVAAVAELSLASRLLAAGRRLDLRLRVRVFEKARVLGDRYFQTRLSSDLASRVHSLHQLRDLPVLAERGLRIVGEACATTAGLIWLDPASAPAALALVVAAVFVPLLAVPFLSELDLRFKTHAGALSRYYLDALLGLIPLRTHGAERPLRREHARVMGEWARSGASFVRASAMADGLQTCLGFGLAAWLLVGHLGRTNAMSLLVVYWALRMPTLGDELVQLMRLYPSTRNVLLRLLEPLNAAEEPAVIDAPTPRPAAQEGMAVTLDHVSVDVAGHRVLHDVSAHFRPGEHVAVVGPSGAGKSTLVGLLLGWHRIVEGALTVDGASLDESRLPSIRRETAWVDPAVHLWNRSLLDNVRYGNPDADAQAAGFAVTTLELQGLVQQLPEGLQTRLGENGALVSGGEGQRVRLARGLLRDDVRLVILDEPFRGLTRDRRDALLDVVRGLWRHATVICITHDVEQTRRFERVLVVEDGTIVEDGAPAALLERDTRYRALFTTDAAVRADLWANPVWRQLRLQDGRLLETTSGT